MALTKRSGIEFETCKGAAVQPDSSSSAWPMVRLADICNIWGGSTPSKSEPGYWNGDMPWLSSKDIKHTEVTQGTEFITEKALEAKSLRVCEPGAIIVVMRSGVLAHTFPVSITTQRVTINQDLKALDSGNLTTNKFISWFLRASEADILRESRRDGTTVQSIQLPVLKELLIPMPPVEVQASIVRGIESATSMVDGISDRLGLVPALLKKFRQSVLAAACSGQLTADYRLCCNLPEWQEETLGSVTIGKPKNGFSPRPVKVETKWKVLTLTATTSGTFDSTQYKFFDQVIPSDSEFWVKDKDIFFQRGNTIELVGTPALYRGKSDEFIYPDLMMRVRADMSRITPEFLVLAASGKESREFLRENSTGTQGSMPKINQPTLMSLPLQLPDLEEQTEIVRRVESLFAIADSIESRLAKATAQVERTTQAILAKAFRGEL